MTLSSSIGMACINSLKDKNHLLLVLLTWAHSCQFKQYLSHPALVLMKNWQQINGDKSSWSSKVPSGLREEQFSRWAEQSRGSEMAKKSSAVCAAAWAILPSTLFCSHAHPPLPLLWLWPSAASLPGQFTSLYQETINLWRWEGKRRNQMRLFSTERAELVRWAPQPAQDKGGTTHPTVRMEGELPLPASISCSASQPSHNISPLNVQMCAVEEPVSFYQLSKAGDTLEHLTQSCLGPNIDSDSSQRRREGENLLPAQQDIISIHHNYLSFQSPFLPLPISFPRFPARKCISEWNNPFPASPGEDLVRKSSRLSLHVMQVCSNRATAIHKAMEESCGL